MATHLPGLTLRQAELYLQLQKKKGFKPFRALSSESDFSDLEQRVLDRLAISHYGVNQTTALPISMDGLVVVSMNDSALMSYTGRLKHVDSSDARDKHAILFAPIVWDDAEKQLFLEQTPIQRMRLAAIWSNWMWSSGHSKVLDIRMPTATRVAVETSRVMYRVEVRVAGTAPEHYADRVSILVWIHDTLLYFKLADITKPGLTISGDLHGAGRQRGTGPWMARTPPYLDNHTYALFFSWDDYECCEWAEKRRIGPGYATWQEALHDRMLKDAESYLQPGAPVHVRDYAEVHKELLG